eukprot:g1278.t1
MLLNYGASANITDRKKNSPLILAASAGYAGSCRALLDHGANSAYRNILGLTALLAAIMHQKISTALLLIKLGADISVSDGQGNTPLHYACEANTLDVARFLLENEHKVRVYNKFNETPMMEAKRQCNIDMQKLLHDFDMKQYPQHHKSKKPSKYDGNLVLKNISTD